MAITPIQRAAIAAGAAMGALMNPGRADLVAALGETTGSLALRRIRDAMRADPTGRVILAERPRVTEHMLDEARECAPDTFGAAYAQFMMSRKFSPDERPLTRFVEDPELAYVITRSREVHDFWHVLFGLPTNVSGELVLKMVEFVQTGLPMCALSVVGGPLRLKEQRRRQLLSQMYPWAITAGLNASPLMCVYYEKCFDERLQDMRLRLCIQPAPFSVGRF